MILMGRSPHLTPHPPPQSDRAAAKSQDMRSNLKRAAQRVESLRQTAEEERKAKEDLATSNIQTQTRGPKQAETENFRLQRERDSSETVSDTDRKRIAEQRERETKAEEDKRIARSQAAMEAASRLGTSLQPHCRPTGRLPSGRRIMPKG
jgi:hypothetical protein